MAQVESIPDSCGATDTGVVAGRGGFECLWVTRPDAWRGLVMRETWANVFQVPGTPETQKINMRM